MASPIPLDAPVISADVNGKVVAAMPSRLRRPRADAFGVAGPYTGPHTPNAVW